MDLIHLIRLRGDPSGALHKADYFLGSLIVRDNNHNKGCAKFRNGISILILCLW